MNRRVLVLVALLIAVPALLLSSEELSAPENESILEPCLKEFVLPGYPALARQALAQGDVSARIHVLADGAVGSVTVSEGHPLLTDHVREALTEWKFQTSTHEFDVDVTIRFSLREPGTDRFAAQKTRGSLPRLFEIVTNRPAPLGPDVQYKKP